jgi:hypothetical protein
MTSEVSKYKINIPKGSESVLIDLPTEPDGILGFGTSKDFIGCNISFCLGDKYDCVLKLPSGETKLIELDSGATNILGIPLELPSKFKIVFDGIQNGGDLTVIYRK